MELRHLRYLPALAEIDSGIALMSIPQKTLIGRLAIGTTHTLNMSVVPLCLALFSRTHPSVHVGGDSRGVAGGGLLPSPAPGFYRSHWMARSPPSDVHVAVNRAGTACCIRMAGQLSP